MAAPFPFELVSPERLLVSESVDEVIAPGTEGEFTVLAGHAPFLTTLKPGIVTVKAGATTRRLFVRGGFADVNPQGCTILADQAIPMESLDEARLDAEIGGAEAERADALSDDGRLRAQNQVDRLRELKAALAAGTATH